MTDKTERWQSVLAALQARADHPATPSAEAELARSKALYFMQKYGIDLSPKLPAATPSASGIRALDCQCARFSLLDPSGTYGAPLLGWTAQAPHVAMSACPAHGTLQIGTGQGAQTALSSAPKHDVDLPGATEVRAVQHELEAPDGHVEVNQDDYDPFAQGCTCRMFVPEQWLGISPEAMASYSLPQVAERVPVRECPIKEHRVEWIVLATGDRRQLGKGQGYA